MDLTNIVDLKALLRSNKFNINKSLGQNFLLCKKSLQKIVEAAQITNKDEIIEIGPGFGVLTEYLLLSDAKKVVALEFDKDLVQILKKNVGENSKLEIYNIDALKFSPPKKNYLLIANIPYYITSPILRHYLSNSNPPKLVILLIQKEVAEKVCINNNQSILSLEVGIYGKPSIEGIVKKENFFPVPKVDSAILKIEMYKKCLVPNDLLQKFWKITKLAFNQKRKKISNTIGKLKINDKQTYSDILEKVGIDISRRPQTLSIDEWISIITYK